MTVEDPIEVLHRRQSARLQVNTKVEMNLRARPAGHLEGKIPMW